MLKDVGNESGVVVVGCVRVLRKDISVFAKEVITDPTFHASLGGLLVS